MTLKDLRKDIYNHITKNEEFTLENSIKEDIFSGNLLSYIKEVLKNTLSENYYKKIKDRVIPINVYPRIIDKVSKVYSYGVSRTVENEDHQEIINYYVEKFDLDSKMMYADRYSNMFKGYLGEPFYDPIAEDVKFRVLPFDRFIPYSTNVNDDMDANVMIKLMGKRMVGKEEKTVYYTYTKDEFDAFDSDLKTYAPAFGSNEQGVNPFGTIPFLYGNRDVNKLIPTQDTDIVAMAKMIPVLMTDLGGAIMFQCFTIIYTIDCEAGNLEMNPNAVWSFSSNNKSEKDPKIGTIKPEADIDKVLNFIKNVFAFWLETKGIKAGSLGSINGENLASGISKVIDEMDVSELRRENSKHFIREEKEFWRKMVKIHNYWVDAGLVKKLGKLPEDLKIDIEFNDPTPKVDENAVIDREIKKLDKGLTTKERAIQKINPDMGKEAIQEIINEGVINDEKRAEKTRAKLEASREENGSEREGPSRATNKSEGAQEAQE